MGTTLTNAKSGARTTSPDNISLTDGLVTVTNVANLSKLTPGDPYDLSDANGREFSSLTFKGALGTSATFSDPTS